MSGLDDLLGPLVSEVVARGAGQTLAQSLSSALASGAAGGLSNYFSSGAFNGLKFSSPDLQKAVQQAQQQVGQQPDKAATPPPSATPPDAAPSSAAGGAAATGGAGGGNTLDDVVVTPSAANAGSALSQVISGAAGQDFLHGGTSSDPATGDQSGQKQTDDTLLDGVDVMATKPPAAPSMDPSLLAPPAFLGGAALLSTGGPGPVSFDATPVPAQTAPPDPTADPSLLVPATLLGGAALLPGLNPGPLNTTPSGGGIDPKTLLPLAPLIPAILGAGGPGGSVPGDPSGSLAGLAQNSADLANRLGNIASSGFAGDIGGRGLNSINRMVTKAQAAIRQRYAAMGMSGSTAEEQDLQAAADSGVDLQFKIGQEMAQTGLNAITALTGQSAQIYTSLLNAQTAKDTALGNTYASFIGDLTTFLGGLTK